LGGEGTGLRTPSTMAMALRPKCTSGSRAFTPLLQKSAALRLTSVPPLPPLGRWMTHLFRRLDAPTVGAAASMVPMSSANGGAATALAAPKRAEDVFFIRHAH